MSIDILGEALTSIWSSPPLGAALFAGLLG